MTATYEAIATTTLGSAASSVSFTSISSSFTDIVIAALASSTDSGEGTMFLRFNNDSSSLYSYTRLLGNGSSASSARDSNRTNAPIGAIGFSSTNFTTHLINVQNYANSTTYKTTISRSSSPDTSAAAYVALWRSTSAINRIDLFAPSGFNFRANSTFTLYGIASA